MDTEQSPGFLVERLLQEKFGSSARARAFYRSQRRDGLNPWMHKFIAEQEMAVIASLDARGACDCWILTGVKGFVHVLDERTLAYPEYRGNGVSASLGNFVENPYIGMLFVDLLQDTIGLHVNGSAAVLSYEDLLRRYDLRADLRKEADSAGEKQPQWWIAVSVEEADVRRVDHLARLAKLKNYIDCRADASNKKIGDYFHVNEWS